MATPPQPAGDSVDTLATATDATRQRPSQHTSATAPREPEVAKSEPPPPNRGTATKKWSEVAASPAFKALADADKDKARQAYFNEVIAPDVAPDKFNAAREQFYRDSGFGARLSTDPERQSRSGYVPGAPRTANGGLSTFAVDNANGGRDAVVRLYFEGRKPPSRSFYVRQGEKFTARSLSPGMYVMRYRFIGDEETYEAEREFMLTEVETEGGRRFSSATVTLFTSTDGNLSTRRVPPEQF